MQNFTGQNVLQMRFRLCLLLLLSLLQSIDIIESLPLGLEASIWFDRSNIPSTGHISKIRLQEVDLTNFTDLDIFCNANKSPYVRRKTLFTSCWGRFDGIKILASEGREDMEPWIMKQNLPFDVKMAHVPLSIRSNQTVEFYDDGRGGVPEVAKPFASHLVAIPNVFMSKWGYIFDRNKLYNFGGCTNRAWNSPTLEIDLRKFKASFAYCNALLQYAITSNIPAGDYLH